MGSWETPAFLLKFNLKEFGGLLPWRRESSLSPSGPCVRLQGAPGLAQVCAWLFLSTAEPLEWMLHD